MKEEHLEEIKKWIKKLKRGPRGKRGKDGKDGKDGNNLATALATSTTTIVTGNSGALFSFSMPSIINSPKQIISVLPDSLNTLSLIETGTYNVAYNMWIYNIDSTFDPGQIQIQILESYIDQNLVTYPQTDSQPVPQIYRNSSQTSDIIRVSGLFLLTNKAPNTNFNIVVATTAFNNATVGVYNANFLFTKIA